MQRRALLATIAAGAATLSGCQATPATDTTTTTTTATTTTTTTDSGPPQTTERAPEPPDTGLTGATTAVLETGDRTLSLLPSHRSIQSGIRVQSWLSATATAEHPATITATRRNPTEHQTAVRLQGLGPFAETPFASPDREHGGDAGLYLVPTEDHEFATRVPAVARDDAHWYLDERPGDWHPRTLVLDPGEVAVAKLWVVTHYQQPGVLATGRYAFGYDDPMTIVAWQTSRPGPTEPSRFEDATPPAFGGEMRPKWFHDADAATPVYLQPSTERAETPAAVEFVLHNYTTTSLTGNRYDWALFKQVDDEWFHIAPWGIPVPLTPLAPGDTFTWTLHAFPGESVACQGARDIGYLGGGRYAFHVGMSPEKGRNRAAMFDLVGPAAEVVPTDAAEASRAGSTVEVSVPVSEHEGPATLVLERADAADERLIVEQVMRRRYRALRNTLAFVDADVTQVRLHTGDQSVDDLVGHDAEERRFRFDGQAYVARRVTTETE